VRWIFAKFELNHIYFCKVWIELHRPHVFLQIFNAHSEFLQSLNWTSPPTCIIRWKDSTSQSSMFVSCVYTTCYVYWFAKTKYVATIILNCHKNAVIVTVKGQLVSKLCNFVVNHKTSLATEMHINSTRVSWKVSCIAELDEKRQGFLSHSSLQVWRVSGNSSYFFNIFHVSWF
jgi:hypothetical protein